jgi:hypothetical protein
MTMKTNYRQIGIIILLSILANGYSCSTKDSTTTVQNLRTFAKIYGYVRYFHPSDEASEINWQRFLLYGSKNKDK